MTARVEYSQPQTPWDRTSKIRQVALRATAALSLIAFVLQAAIWVQSYRVPYPSSAADTGLANSQPTGVRILLPLPSDCVEYCVALDGGWERWEYAPWERKWYRLNTSMPMWLTSAIFLVLPIVWTVNLRSRNRGSLEALASAK